MQCLLDAHAVVGESPVWCEREQVLWWVDIDSGILYRTDPVARSSKTWEIGEEIGCIALRQSGGLVVALRTGFAFFDPATGKLDRLSDPEADKPENRFNDGSCDTEGRLWAGTMRMAEYGPGNGAEGSVYRLDPDGTVTKMLDGFGTTNGMAFSPDGKRFYISDSNAAVRTIWKFDYDPATGTLSERQVFVDTHGMKGRPDGGAMDAEGCYWMSGIGGGELVRFRPDGSIQRTVSTPVLRPTKLAFGGADLTTGFVTSLSVPNPAIEDSPQAGGLFMFDAQVRGLPSNRFG